MNSETKICQNCKNQFTIEPDDFAFYEKIDVPAPTFCPECRMQRRMAFRNERSLFRRKCDFSGQEIISGFAPDSPFTVYERDIWWSDKWDSLDHGLEYNFKEPFFKQFRKLLERVPVPSVFNARTTNTEYSNHTGEYKNGYLVFASWTGENITYASRCSFSKDCMDVYSVFHCELCYEAITSMKLYRTLFSQNCGDCTESAFLFDCRGCNNCFGCTNLRNKSYYIFNKPYSKEEYQNKLKEFDIGSYETLEKMKQRVAKMKLGALHKYANIINCQNVTGDNLANVANSSACFDIADKVRDCKYIINGGFNLEDSYDGYGVGEHAELLYEAFDAGVQGTKFRFAAIVYGGHDVHYLYNSYGCDHCFGCIGLQNKSYCILNKQYSKEEYNLLLPRIIKHMEETPYIDKKGREHRYGEFFPIEISPFAYNESIAQDYFPLSREEIQKEKYQYREPISPTHKPTMRVEDLPDHVKNVKDSIVDEVIGCRNCGQPYRILRRELDFLKQLNIALPRFCSECRHLERFGKVNFPRLHHRQCLCDYKVYKNVTKHRHHPEGRCPNEFETSYAPERKEIVYCEQCYQSEVV